MSSVLAAVVRGPSVPFGRAVDRRKDSGAADLKPLSVYLEAGVVPRASRDDNYNRLGADLSEYLIVEPGDVVFNKLRTWQGGLGVSKHAGIVSPAYYVCRPRQGYEPRFLHYLFRSSPYLAELTRISKFMPPSQFDILWEDLRALPIPKIALAVQRAIADFLDTETARIDALITKKRRMIELLEERRWSEFRLATTETDAPRVPARRALVSVTDGPFGSAFTSGEYSDNGVAVIRLGNIGYAEFRGHDLVHLPLNRFAEFRHYEVRQGDILFAGLGDERNHAGRACVAPDLGPAIVKGKCFCGRIDTTRAVPDFIALYFSSPMAASSLATEARGSTRQMINLEILKAVEVPLPSVERQMEIVEAVRRRWGMQATLHRNLNDQLALLREHRQALITAAVSGDLEVPGVAA